MIYFKKTIKFLLRNFFPYDSFTTIYNYVYFGKPRFPTNILPKTINTFAAMLNLTGGVSGYLIESIIWPTSCLDMGIKATQRYQVSNRFQFDFIRLGPKTGVRGHDRLPPTPSLTYHIPYTHPP